MAAGNELYHGQEVIGIGVIGAWTNTYLALNGAYRVLYDARRSSC